VTSNGSAPPASPTGSGHGSVASPAARSEAPVVAAVDGLEQVLSGEVARDQAFRAELAAMGLIPDDELPAQYPPATPEDAAVRPGPDAGGAAPGPSAPHAGERPGNAGRAPFIAAQALVRAGRAVGFALRRTVLEPSLAADVRRDRELATGLRATWSGCRRVLVLSASPGCGQSSVAALIALSLSRVRDDRVAAVDVNSGAGSLSSRLGQPLAPTAGEMLVTARRARQGGALSPRLGLSTPLTVLRMEGRGVDQIEEATQALLALERGVAVTVVDPGFSPGVFLQDTLLAGTETLVVVAPANGEPLAERLLGAVAARGHKVLADTAIVVRSGERAARSPRASAGWITVLPMPKDDALANQDVLDLAAMRPVTRRAVTAISLAVMAERQRPVPHER